MPNKNLFAYFAPIIRGNDIVNLKKLSLQSIVCKMIMVLACSWLFHNVSASTFNIDVPEGSAEFSGDLAGNVSVNKIGAGTLVYTEDQTYTGVTNVLEGTLGNNGSMQSSAVKVSLGASYTGTGEVLVLNSDGDVAIGGAVGSSSTVHDYRPSPSSSLSIRLNSLTSDWLTVDTAALTGALKVYVDTDGHYPATGTIYPIIRGGLTRGIFTSFVNVNEANVTFDYEYDNDEYCLVVIGGVPYVRPTRTSYRPGLLLGDCRRDTIETGCAGGFSGFTVPYSACKELHISFMRSGTVAAANTILTNSYTGSGAVPYLPTTVDDLWLEGDATDFATLVSGGVQYGLPTPGVKTTIHFLLSAAPTTSPLTWFQGALPSGCRLVIEPGSADPFINTVLPLAGGHIIIGAPVAPEAGFSALLAGMTGPCRIQRHPKVAVGDAASQALITLAETTRFPYAVNGISLTGGYATTFGATSDIVDPTADSASAGYIVDERSVLTILRSRGHTELPAISSYLVPGGTSNIVVTMDASTVKLPKLLPPLD